MFSNALLLLFSLAVSAAALATPHPHRALHHRALAGRVAVPAPVDLPSAPVRRRANSKRCRPRSSAQAPTSRAPETTKEPSPPKTTHKPEPTTKYTPPPKPSPTTTHKEEPPATTKKPSPPPSSNLPSFMVGTQTGEGTFYATGLTACGVTNKDTDYIAAVSHLLFDAFPGYNGANPNNNPICGRKVQVEYEGKHVTVAITDRCEGCAITDLDFSPSAFNQLADFAKGRIAGIKWHWL